MAAMAALDVMENEPEHIEQLWENARFMMKGFRELGFNIGNTQTPIIPLIVGDDDEVLPALEGALRERRLHESRDRPRGAAGHGPAPDQLHGVPHAGRSSQRALDVFAKAGKAVGVI